MAAAEYYQDPKLHPQQHPYQQSSHLSPQTTGISHSQPSWTPEPPKSPWERPQHIYQPAPVYESHPQPYYGEGQGNGNGKPQVVVVKQGRSGKEDAALGFCAGCTAACCCCGCSVM